jgi:hypothetical protein
VNKKGKLPMKNHKLTNEQSSTESGKPSPKLRKRQRTLYSFLAMTAIVVLAGCVSDGYYGGYYGYPGYYHYGGYYGGGFHGGGYGIQHGFGRSGFGHGGFGGGGRRH